MPQFSTMSNLGSSETFYPVRVDANGVAHLRTRGDSVADSKSISIGIRQNPRSGIFKVTVRVTYPYWYTPKGDSTKKNREVMRFEGTFIIPPHASETQREELYNLVKAFVAHNNTRDAVKLLEALF